MTVVGEGGEASVTGKGHAKDGQHALVARPPLFHGRHDVGFVAPFLQFSDDGDDGDMWGDLIANAEDGIVRLFHALCDPRDAAHTEDEEVYPAFLAEFPEERSEGMLRSLGGDVSKRALAKSRGVPETKRVRVGVCFPGVCSGASGDAADVVGGGRGV